MRAVAPVLRLVFVGKAARVFVSALLSVATPIYLASVGYSAFVVAVVLAVILASNAASNVVLARVGFRFGLKRTLYAFGLLMTAAGALLYLSSSLAVILLACLIGNISTTGTEAGPFQSAETGILPGLVEPGRLSRTYGLYNLVGYSASSVGALASSAPAYAANELSGFRILFLAYAAVGLLLLALYSRMGDIEPPSREAGGSTEEYRTDVRKLSALFSLDAFGGSFVSQFVFSYWFNAVYGVPLSLLGPLFLVSSVLSAASSYGASLLAERLGNLRTMFYTHVLSNVFLIMIPLVGSLAAAVALLFCRQSVSQMDVPTRQAFMAGILPHSELVAANATTNTARSLGSVTGGPFTAAFFAVGVISGPLFLGGASKLVYDFLIFASYRTRARCREGGW